MNTKEYNLGIEILRVFLSFSVVMDHLYNSKKLKKYIYVLYYHIPTFFIISFYFTYNTLLSFNIQKIKLRFERLLIPYFAWSIIGWLLRNIYYYIFNLNYVHSFEDFARHIITGHILNIVLWYQAILMFTTIIFLIIIFLFKKKCLFILHILALISYILQYSGLNLYLHNKYLNPHAALTFGRFPEAFPNAVTGFTFSFFKIITFLKKYRLNTIFYSSIILIMISTYNIFDNLKTFKYGGIRLNIGASCIFIIFSLLPFENIKNKTITNFIRQITRYTGGIYYMHYLVGTSLILTKILKNLNGTIIGCIFVYITCFFISHFSLKIFGKSKFKYIFI